MLIIKKPFYWFIKILIFSMNSLLMSEWLSSYKISSSNSITSEFQKKSLSCDSYSEWFPMIIKDLIIKNKFISNKSKQKIWSADKIISGLKRWAIQLIAYDLVFNGYSW